MKSLKIELNAKLGLVPPVLSLLAGEIPDTYKWYKLRHPGGIFNVQFLNVSQDILQVLEDLKHLRMADPAEASKQGSSQDEAISRLLRSYSALLFSFTNYLESAYEILVAFCPKHSPPSDNEFLWRWLKNKGYPAGQNFHKDVIDDVHFFKTMFNKLKHTSNTLRTSIMLRADNNQEVVGYYLESPDTDGALGSDETLHPKFKGKATANSFNRDLRRIYLGIYLIADALATRLKQHYKQIRKKEMVPDENRKEDDSVFRRLFEGIEALESAYVPNEFGDEVPIASIVEDDKKRFLVFAISKPPAPSGVPYRVLTTMKGDG